MNVTIIPRPQHCVETGDGYQLSVTTTISAASAPDADDEVGSIAQHLAERLRASTGFGFPIRSDGEGNITLSIDRELEASAYRLDCDCDGVRITGGDPAGLFHGTQTLLQLAPADVFRSAPIPRADWTLPGVRIKDRPRFGWRGFMLDTSRHFFGKNIILTLIDALALHRMNVLHLHLTDDQGWRIQIKKYPLLTQVGAWRRGSELAEACPDDPDDAEAGSADYGGYFTQDDLREIVEYAGQRYITVVPEIDLPGHSQAAIAAYPRLGNARANLEVWTKWSINRHVLNPSPETVAFFCDVLDEVMDIFPSTYIHIGGDECLKTEWVASPAIQEQIRSLGLADEDTLQSWFIAQLGHHLTANGRRLIGWDEIIEGGLPEGAAVMAWRDEAAGVMAATSGHDVVMTPEAFTYLYRAQGEDPVLDGPGAEPPLDLQTVFGYQPIPSELPDDSERHILGAQCQMWTEFVHTPRQMERMVFPRLCAFSEVVWTGQRGPFSEFEARMADHRRRLWVLGLDFHRGGFGEEQHVPKSRTRESN